MRRKIFTRDCWHNRLGKETEGEARRSIRLSIADGIIPVTDSEGFDPVCPSLCEIRMTLTPIESPPRVSPFLFLSFVGAQSTDRVSFKYPSNCQVCVSERVCTPAITRENYVEKLRGGQASGRIEENDTERHGTGEETGERE